MMYLYCKLYLLLIMSRVKIIIAIGSILSLMLVVSCVKEGSEPEPPVVNPLTLIVYMGGDNNLWNETFDKIRAMAAVNLPALQNPDATILIYQDVPANRGEGLSRLWRLRYSKAGPQNSYADLELLPTLQLIASYPKEHSASPAVFARVIRRCLEIAPAPRYGLWVFSHASGWLPQGTLITPRSIIQDSSSEMDLKEFAAAIPDHTFDFVVFETCLMAGVEVAYELKDKTDYLITSSAEILSPGFTEIYDRVLPPLFEPDMELPNALIQVARAYFEHWNAKSGWEKSATIGVIRTKKLKELASVARNIFAEGNSGPDLSTLQHFNRSLSWLYFDCGEYLATLATSKQRSRLSQILSEVVIYQAATSSFMLEYTGFPIEAHSGLTIYIPQNKFPYLNAEYKKMQWYINTAAQ